MVIEQFVVFWLAVTFTNRIQAPTSVLFWASSINNEMHFSLSDADVGSQNSGIKRVTFA
jgi:hypothetical protein